MSAAPCSSGSGGTIRSCLTDRGSDRNGVPRTSADVIGRRRASSPSGSRREIPIASRPWQQDARARRCRKRRLDLGYHVNHGSVEQYRRRQLVRPCCTRRIQRGQIPEDARPQAAVLHRLWRACVVLHLRRKHMIRIPVCCTRRSESRLRTELAGAAAVTSMGCHTANTRIRSSARCSRSDSTAEAPRRHVPHVGESRTMTRAWLDSRLKSARRA